MAKWTTAATGLVLVAAISCGGGGGASDLPAPTPGLSILTGKTVLVLPVQYARQLPDGWVGGASGRRDAALQATSEIVFALGEYGGRADWVFPDQQQAALDQQPAIEGVSPYMLSAGDLLREGSHAKDFRDPLYGQIRMLAALFDARYAVWPLEVFSLQEKDEPQGRLAIRAYLLDVRAGTVLWYGIVPGDDQPPASAGALATLAQIYAELISP
jgi:hypothetical protein